MTSWIDVAGWTLLHFVWQGSVIALMAALALRALRSSRANVRYSVACVALAAMLAAPVVTAVVLTSAPRGRIAESIHVLRSSQGALVGVAFTTPWSALPRSINAAPPAVTELKLPTPINTDTLFSGLVTVWLAGVAILLLRLTA